MGPGSWVEPSPCGTDVKRKMAGSEESDKYKKDISESRTLHDPPLLIEYSRPATVVKRFRHGAVTRGR